MTSMNLRVLLLAAAATATASCMKAETGGNNSQATAASNAEAPSNNPTASAESAAPASIAAGATIMQAAADGSMQVIRKGTNGWTCMPDNPVTPGPDPMCMDANGLKWAEAWIGRKPPPEGIVGVMYMLEGGTDASNTDPYAKEPTADNDWVKTGPHLMVVGSKEILASHPSGAKPDTSMPYVMWAGTPYAHLMIPVGDAAN